MSHLGYNAINEELPHVSHLGYNAINEELPYAR